MNGAGKAKASVSERRYLQKEGDYFVTAVDHLIRYAANVLRVADERCSKKEQKKATCRNSQRNPLFIAYLAQTT